MDGPRRAYDLLRGYVNREWDRIHEVEETYAERELREALDTTWSQKGAEPNIPHPAPTLDNVELARRYLGVVPSATFEEIRRAFERLNKRSDPANFPKGTDAATQAAGIQRRVQWAYSVLTEGMDVTERRFRSLEIE